ncbi:Multidrug resistance-associated protein 1 [Termitomyces sp. J132]|nr:Multidrug resistance-associated protein 1 [Termitomyces sp. J132]
MWNLYNPRPAPPAFGAGKDVPEGRVSILSRVFFSWLDPLLYVGFTRPLEEHDLWKLPDEQSAENITKELERAYYSRCPPHQRPKCFPHRAARSDADFDAKFDSDMKEVTEKESDEAAKDLSVYDSSLFKALHTAFFKRIWIAGALHLCSDTLKTLTPLLNKVILTWLTNSYVYFRLSDEQKASGIIERPRGIGYGIGLAFALFVMQGLMMRAGVCFSQHLTDRYSLCLQTIGSIFRKSLRLSGRAKLEHTVGQITTMISTDATRIDQFAAFAHFIWVAPIQVRMSLTSLSMIHQLRPIKILIGIGLLIGNLGYSALVGLAVMVFGLPFQAILVMIIFKQREKGVKITDIRVRLTTEVLQGIRLLKVYAWEEFYAAQIGTYRAGEIAALRKTSIASSILIASITFIPVVATVLSFITYALTGHDLNIAVVFTSLQLFTIIRVPFIVLPIVLASLADLLVALTRISKFLSAEELGDPYVLDESLPTAVEVDGDFTWETAGKMPMKSKGDKIKTATKEEAKTNKGRSKKLDTLPTHMGELVTETREKNSEEDKPFELKNLKLCVPKGSFVAIVGHVGSGKSSVLQSVIGEMRRTRGKVVLGGTVAYVPQTAWIRNATLRENVLFGREDDETRFREVIKACHLERDLEMLPHGEKTEIGEKGINLSGGQKARVSLARAAYSDSDIVLLDDPLSAVDAYVGKGILDQCLLSGPLSTRTRILATHVLHVLKKTDYIFIMDRGVIAEQGTYEDLVKNSSIFSSLMDEHGSLEAPEGARPQREIRTTVVDWDQSGKEVEAALMQVEERNTGAVIWDVYKKYLRFSGGFVWVPIIVCLLLLNESSQVGNNLFLGFWTGGIIEGFSQGQYMAVYAGLGVAQALFSCLLSLAFSDSLFSLMCLVGSLRLFKAALKGVLGSPVSFFDTTPMGRIQSRLSKDQDTLDVEIAATLWQFLSTSASVLGTIALVFYTFPLLGIIFAPLIVLYYICSVFYRRTSVETKRLDSILRSVLYGSYSETLTGLATIRAYGEQNASIIIAEKGLDLENRAYYMTISIQRWLSVRLDLFGNVLILGIALFAAGYRHSVNPAKIGVVLSYTLAKSFKAEMINQFAKNEQNMNAVERVLHYTELSPEAASTTPDDPPPSWPEKGQISFTNVDLAYREGLPLVLKDVSFNVHSGEKIGIVGRTGAVTLSLNTLFTPINSTITSTVELRNGKIEIDGCDISRMGLSTLRNSIALVPQDSTMFIGTLRSNLDPKGLCTDAELVSVIQRAGLLSRSDPTVDVKFSLDSTVGDEGLCYPSRMSLTWSNYSVGEKQLIALCRALVKNSRVIILDEATSSVDVETDAKLQRTIKKEFASSTLLCIAHRLNTIAYYDRVLVMDAGKVAEFDTVLNLYDNETSIFRSLCSEANLQRADILRIRAEYGETA